jgi:hypothetical protein
MLVKLGYRRCISVDDSDHKKLETLLSYWIEHNTEHGAEFKEWAEKAKELGGSDVGEDLLAASRQIDEVNKSLLSAAEKLKK